MGSDRRWLLGQQLAVAVAVTGAALVFSPRFFSAFHLPKMMVVAVAAAVALLLALAGAWRDGVLRLRRDPAVIAAIVLAIVLVVATVTSPIPWVSVVGEQTRRAGLVSYISYLVLFVVTVHAFDGPAVGRLVRLVSLTALGVAGYAALQAFGLDPIAWDGTVEGHSTLGNPNYVAAFLGMAAPLALWSAISTRDPGEGALHAAAVIALLAVLPLTRSVQGAVVVAGSLGLFGLAWLSLREGRLRTVGLASWVGVLAVGTATFAAGLVGAGPLGSLAARPTVLSRVYLWQTAVDMWREHPISGVGLELFHAHVRVHRPPELLEVLGPDRVSASSHNVPLDMLASGGLVLGAAYFLFIVVIGVVLMRGLLRTQRADRLLLAAVGGAWVGYQLQSLVSIDVPSLAVLHYVLAGAIVALAGRGTRRTYRLSRSGALGTAGGRASVVAVPLLGAVVLAIAVVPLRADLAARDAVILDRSPVIALEAADVAVRWTPREPRYRELRARLLERAGEEEAAAGEWRALLDVHPRWLRAYLGLARIADATGDAEQASRHYARALELEPLRPAVRREIARFERDRDRPEDAIRLVEGAVEVLPGDADSWLLLGELHVDVGDEDAARAAFERAVETGSGETASEARRWLEELGSG